jgi:N-methylhydantoinase A
LPDAIPPAEAKVPAQRRAWFPDAGWVETPVVDRAALAGGERAGRVIVQEYDATCLVPQGWVAALDAFGNIRLKGSHEKR